MTVYVDRARHERGRMVMCHMAADSLDELHAMASALGIQRWFQDKPGLPHYDLVKATRARAVAIGAVEATSRQIVEAARRCG